MLVVELVGGGGGGATTPLVSICPASTQTESNRLRTVAAVIRRKVFTIEPPKRVAKILQFEPDKDDRSANLLQEPDGLR